MLLAGPGTELKGKLTEKMRYRPTAMIKPLMPAGASSLERLPSLMEGGLSDYELLSRRTLSTATARRRSSCSTGRRYMVQRVERPLNLVGGGRWFRDRAHELVARLSRLAPSSLSPVHRARALRSPGGDRGSTTGPKGESRTGRRRRWVAHRTKPPLTAPLVGDASRSLV